MEMTKIEQEKHRALRIQLNEIRTNGEDVMISDRHIIRKADWARLADKRSNPNKKE